MLQSLIQPPASAPQNTLHQPPQQTGSGRPDRHELGYTLHPQRAYDAARFGVKGTDYKISLRNANTRSYQQLVDEFRDVMSDIVDETLGDADPNDFVRFVLKSTDFDIPLNTAYQRRSQVNGEWLSKLSGKLLQSHEELDLDNNLLLHVQHVALPRGNAPARKLTVNMLVNIFLKRCVLTSVAQYDDIPCFGYALLLSVMLLSTTVETLQDFVTNKVNVERLVMAMYQNAGEPYAAVDVTQFSKFLCCLPANSRLIVVDARDQGTSLLFKSDICNVTPVDNVIPSPNNICLLLYKEHYYPLISLPAWFGRSYYCIECEIAYNTSSRHVCKSARKCNLCCERTCLNHPAHTRCCSICFGAFRNSTCFTNHRTNGVCESSSSCDTCGKWFTGPLPDHNCNATYCCYCSKTVNVDHRCFIQVKKQSPIETWKYVFYDFECTQNSIDDETNRPVHVVNYCVAMSVCHKCPSDVEPCENCAAVRVFSGLRGEDALVNFCKWACDDPSDSKAVFVAHNASNYDSHFILSYLVDNAEYPDLLANGGKLLQMYVKCCKITFIDSCCFLALPLSRFSETFQIPHTKGTFPHLFNTSNNYDYVGALPALQYYDPDGLKESSRKELIKWHSDHVNDEFNFAKEIDEYCRADVQLLKSGCMKFRNAFIADTGIDPLQSCTIAGACMNVLRTSHLKQDTIGRIPASGYRSLRNYSNKSMAWITYCEKVTGISYQHAWSDLGEKHLQKAKVWADAYYKSPKHEYVMAFMGCTYHGCQSCYRLQTMNTHLGKTMGDLYRETVRWTERVMSSGYKLSVMWECEWDRMVKENRDISDHVDSYSLSTPLSPRDALFGGRCETFALHAKSTTEFVIKYVDVQSLYPYVCKNKHYPLGHPRCLIGPDLKKFGTDINKFEGLVKCKVLPPRGLHIPLLPSHINDKLMFVLCRTCAENGKGGRCRHSANGRALTGTWVSIELQYAVRKGYEILQFYEAWQYDETTVYDPISGSGGLFARYMNTFMKLKMEASGYPSSCKTEDDKRDYIERVRVHEGISLNPQNIEFNAGRRAVAKLCLNNIWGKFAQTPDRTTKQFVTKPRDFFRLFSDDSFNVSDVQPINDDCVNVSYKKAKEFQTASPNTSVVVASHVTTHARLELYSYLEQLGERALYCDTDSVIYKHAEGSYNPPLSEFVGGMTDELGGSHITEYVSNGPKNYAYRTADGKQVVKIKGFTLNYVASKQLTFDVIKEMAVVLFGL